MNEAERQLIRNIQSHDLAEALRIRRAQEAKEAGLPTEAFSLPFPANVTINQARDNQAGGMPTAKSASGIWPILAVALATAAGGGTVAAGLTVLNKLANSLQNTTPSGASAPTAPTGPAGAGQQGTPMTPAPPPAPVKLRVRWWIEDGEVKHKIEEQK